ncbi:DUF4124 domain-containing protein [Candidatus Albibeggiatoa sp. nov. BB20]|uniref:DUF4124 domain-containing protein n=1 Tax=Candidatus Albibeggiatoa sp. nov. BB20 TaxID=3162723 RepID=UPI0033658CE2
MRYLILFFLLFSTTVYAGKMYQWVDDEGTTHYTQTPPPSYIGAEERVLKTPKPKPELKDAEQTENTDPLQALKEARAQNCKQSRQNLTTLTSNQELVSLATGNETDEEMAEMKPMSIEEREKEIATAQGFINEFCQNVPVEEETEESAEYEVEQE